MCCCGPAAVKCLQSCDSLPQDPSSIFSQQHDPGSIFELLCDSHVAMASKPSAEEGAYNKNLLQELVSTQSAAAKALCQYIHAKCSQKQGLAALAASSSKAGTLPVLLHALGFAASILIRQVTAGSLMQLQKQQVQQHGLRLGSKEITSATARTCNPSTSSLAAAGMHSTCSNAGSGSAAPPSWLHPLLHCLRPDQVVVLVSQPLLCLAGVLEAK